MNKQALRCCPELLMQSGHYVNLLEPLGNKIFIHDIAHGLVRICRFGGQSKHFYAVAQHSVLVSYQLHQAEEALARLLHDTTEAYLGDIPTPLKQLLPDYQAIESRFQVDVLRKLGVALPLPASVKHADLVMLATEQRDIMGNRDPWGMLKGIVPLTDRLTPWSVEAAQEAFFHRYNSITTAPASYRRLAEQQKGVRQ